MLVLDTSAYINGQRDHYPISTFPSVWDVITTAMGDSRIIPPREVYRELTSKDDEIAGWAKARARLFLDPSPDVQRAAGEVFAMFSAGSGRRDGADPFVIAEAQTRGYTVVTYEGRSFGGIPTRNWEKTMPGICQHIGVPCRTLPEALTMLGASF
jgi:Domain of unknown function (DUF4411)